MEIIVSLFFALLFIFVPFYLQKAANHFQLTNILSDVAVCFGFGILLSNTKQWWMPNEAYQQMAFSVAELSTAISVLLAIPMLLMTSDIGAFVRYAPKFLLSFLLCILGVLLATVFTVYWFPDLEHLSQTAGCLVGVYTGGTPNMVAISYAVNAPNELFVILNSTDLCCSGIYLIFLTSIAKPFYSLFLPKSTSATINKIDLTNNAPLDSPPVESNYQENETNSVNNSLISKNLVSISKAMGLALICIGASVGISFLFPGADGKLNEMLLMIVLSTSSILFSFVSTIRSLKGVYEFAQYLLLIFAIAVGFMADFSKLTDVGISYLAFNALLVISFLILQLLFAFIFKIDTDTFIITSTACIFGPPFIGQICSTIKNKEMLAPGMALGVLGLVIGTYLGIFVTSFIGT